MSLIKNIFKSIAILFGIAFLVVMFGFALMMLFDVQIFGFKWVFFDTAEEIGIIYTDVSSADKIYIETNGVAVEVRHSTDVEKIEYRFNGKIQGVYKTDSIVDLQKPVNVSQSVNEQGVYEVKMQEPYGLCFNNDVKVTIWLPNQMNITDLSIKTGTNNFYFDSNTESMQLNNFSFESTTNLKDYTISEKVTVNNDFTLKTSTGRVYVNANLLGNVLVDSIGSTVIFKNDLGSGNSSVRIAGANPHIQVGDKSQSNVEVDINGDIAVDCTNGGLIDISGAVNGTVSLISPHVTFNVKTTNKQVTSNTGFNILNITNLNGDARINKGDGTLFIKNCNADNLIVTGVKNNVTIENLYGNANITNDYGDINVNYANGVSVNHTFVADTKKGAINVTNIPCNAKLTSEDGIINAEFINIVGQNLIQTNNAVNAKIKDNLLYDLIIKTKTASLNIGLGSTDGNNWYKQETESDYTIKTAKVNGGNESNTLKITMDEGNINLSILDL